MNMVLCPHCGKKIEISEALRHQIEEVVSKQKEKEYQEKLLKIKIELEEKTKKEIEEKSRQELTNVNKEKEELEKLLSKEKREREAFEKKVMQEATRTAEEKENFKLKEKELQIEAIKKANEELKRKLDQGSQQLQGEVLELDLEAKLKTSFPTDEFLAVPKGFEGADIWQKVRYKGKIVGSILWETKRTKTWGSDWIPKLKNDAAKISASESIIVSQTLPQDVRNFDRKDGVWITSYEHAISICRYIRFLITKVATVKLSASQTDEEWGKLRDYITSDTFIHRMQAHYDGIRALKDVLDQEKRSTILRWKKQESQIDKLDVNTINFYGELKEMVSNLPEIKGLNSPHVGDGIDDKDEENLL